MNTMIDITETELEQIEGGEYQRGAICALAVGVAVGLALVNPLTLFFTVEAVTAPACIAELAG